MKDAIIVKKVTDSFSHERKRLRRLNEETCGTIFDHFVTILGLVFLGGKSWPIKDRVEDNDLIFKESYKIRRRNKKSKYIPKNTSKKSLIMWGLKIQELSQFRLIDWCEMEMEVSVSWLFYWSYGTESYWRFRMECLYAD